MATLIGTPRKSKHYCATCKENSLNQNAAKYCTHCRNYLCTDCVEHHKKLKMSKGHWLVDIGKEKSLDPELISRRRDYTAFDPEEKTYDSQEVNRYYRKGEPFSVTERRTYKTREPEVLTERRMYKTYEPEVITERRTYDASMEVHRDEEIQRIPRGETPIFRRSYTSLDDRKKVNFSQVNSISRDIRSRENEYGLSNCLEEIRVRLRNINVTVEENSRRIERQIGRTMRQDIVALIDTLDRRIMRERTALRESGDIYSRKRRNLMTQILEEIDDSLTKLESLLIRGSESEISAVIRKLNQQTKDYDSLILDDGKRYDHDVDGKYLRSSRLENDLFEFRRSKTDMDFRGRPILKTKKNPNRLKDCDIECLGEVVFNATGKTQRYSGAACLSDGRIIVVDNANNRLCLFDLLDDFKLKSELYLATKVWKVVAVSENIVAVALPERQTIELIEVGKNMEVVKIIHTKTPCWCLSPLREGYAVVSDCGTKPTFSILSANGTERRSFNKDVSTRRFRGFWHMALNRTQDRVYQTCTETNSVHGFGLDGTPYFTYTHPNLKYPTGIDVDRDGNIYVCGCHSSNVHQLTSDGKLIRIISSPLFRMPLNICFLPGGEEFFVTGHQSKRALMFRIVY